MRMDRSRAELGGIEGLPLQLMIIIIVATMGTAIIVGWMGSIDTPHSIGSVQFEDSIEASNRTISEFTVTVTDQDGALLEGATVVLDGLNVKMDGKTAYATTDSSGSVTFRNLTINPAGSAKVGFISVMVTKPGYTDSSTYKVTVIL